VPDGEGGASGAEEEEEEIISALEEGGEGFTKEKKTTGETAAQRFDAAGRGVKKGRLSQLRAEGPEGDPAEKKGRGAS